MIASGESLVLPMPTGLQLTASKHIEREREEAVSGHEDQLA